MNTFFYFKETYVVSAADLQSTHGGSFTADHPQGEKKNQGSQSSPVACDGRPFPCYDRSTGKLLHAVEILGEFRDADQTARGHRVSIVETALCLLSSCFQPIRSETSSLLDTVKRECAASSSPRRTCPSPIRAFVLTSS